MKITYRECTCIEYSKTIYNCSSRGTQHPHTDIHARKTPMYIKKKTRKRQDSGSAVVAHTVDPRTPEAEATGSLSSRPTWSTKWVQSGLHRKILSQKKQTKTKGKKRKRERGRRRRREDRNQLKTWAKWPANAWKVSSLPGKDYLKPQSSNTTETHQGCRREASQEQRRDQGRMVSGRKELKHRAANSKLLKSSPGAFWEYVQGPLATTDCKT